MFATVLLTVVVPPWFAFVTITVASFAFRFPSLILFTGILVDLLYGLPEGFYGFPLPATLLGGILFFMMRYAVGRVRFAPFE